MEEMDQVRFSESGGFLALSGIDGRLRIWDTVTSTLKQEFTPSSHLSAGCTCLAWSPTPSNQSSGSKKKKKKVLEGEVVVMGTSVGSLLFYDVTKAQLISHSKEAHAGKVNGLSWSSSTLSLYSGGEDGFLLEWEPSTTQVVTRWRGSKHSITAVSVINDNLLAAGNGISLWDLRNKTLLSSFTGHPGQVAQISSIPSSDYFISMGKDDRHLRIWSVGEKNSVATLVVPENPQSYHVSTKEEGRVTIAVATQDGLAHVFQKKLNGHIRKPLIPSSTLEINDKEASNIIPVLCCCLREEEETFLLAGYGSFTKFRFEKFAIDALERTVLREYSSSKRKSEKSQSTNQIQLAEIPMDVKHLQPGAETTAGTASTGKKRKKSGKDEPVQSDGELPMEERLTNLTLQSTSAQSGIRGNNLGHLLSQGLHSKDSRILYSVLSRWDDEVITNTVRSLPVQLVVTLLNEIKVMLAGKGQMNNAILKWLKSVLQIHSTYLMCCPGGEELLGPFMSLLHSREVLYPRLCQLKGKLDLIRGNIEAKKHKSEPVNEALLVFNDDSSAEEVDDEDGGLMAESEDALSSDDLGVTDSDSEEDEEKQAENEMSYSSASESDNEVKQNTSTTKGKRNSLPAANNHAKKIKGKILEDDSGPESMDDDG